MSPRPKILIVGGGIAGLCCALQLARRGVAAMVCEKLPPASSAGYIIGIWKNGFDVLEKLGVADLARQRGITSDFQILTDPQNRAIRSTDMRALNEKYGAGVVFMNRGALVECLLEELQKTGVADVHFNHSVSEVESQESKSRAVFASGKEEYCDLIIGADGINSRVRRAVFGNRGEVTHNGVFYYAVVSMTEWESPLTGDVEMTGAGTFLGLYPFSRRECGIYAAVYRRPGLLSRPPSEVLREYFSGFSGYAPAVIDSCMTAEIFGDVIREANAPRWCFEGGILIGDAAHAMLPTTGQGISLALEDGYLSANIIADSPQEKWAEQFAALEKSRRSRITPIRRRAALTNFVVNHTPSWLCPSRNTLIRLLAGNKSRGLDSFMADNVVRGETHGHD